MMIGEIGGGQEAEAARFAREHVSKPVVGYIAGLTAPKGRRMGHAGAIISASGESAAEKVEILKAGRDHGRNQPVGDGGDGTGRAKRWQLARGSAARCRALLRCLTQEVGARALQMVPHGVDRATNVAGFDGFEQRAMVCVVTLDALGCENFVPPRSPLGVRSDVVDVLIKPSHHGVLRALRKRQMKRFVCP